MAEINPNLFARKTAQELKAEQSTSAESLARKILGFDPGVVGCYIIRVADGVVLTDQVRSEYRSRIKPFASTGEGMASKWGLVGLSASKRMDSERGRTKYLVAARETFSTLLFLHPRDEGLEIGIMLVPSLEPGRIYERAIKEL
jgi:hypothetical protein